MRTVHDYQKTGQKQKVQQAISNKGLANRRAKSDVEDNTVQAIPQMEELFDNLHDEELGSSASGSSVSLVHPADAHIDYDSDVLVHVLC